MLIDLSDNNLTKSESSDVKALLERQNPVITSDLEQMWYLLDMIWDELGCNNRRLNWDKITEYYSYPVWLLNGLFIEQDEESTIHRQSIASYIKDIGVNEVVDYGGGFGTLARAISEHNKNVRVYIYEPYPSDYGLRKVSEYKNITVVDGLKDEIECMVSTDVLEHLDDPLIVLSNMINSVRLGGTILIAAPFQPMIKCHLPKHFHFRYTLRAFCLLMGAKKTGTIAGAPHVSIYVKDRNKQPNWLFIRMSVIASKVLYVAAETVKPFVKMVLK